MKKTFSFLVLSAALTMGFSSCIKDNSYPYNNSPINNLQPGQTVMAFSSSDNWGGSSYFENTAANSVAQRGRISYSSSNDAVGLAGYQYQSNGAPAAAILEIDQSNNYPIVAGRTIYFQHPDGNTQALLTLGVQDNNGYVQDPWYSEAGEIYITRFTSYEIEGTFRARLFRQYNPNQIMEINDGRFYARF